MWEKLNGIHGLIKDVSVKSAYMWQPQTEELFDICAIDSDTWFMLNVLNQFVLNNKETFEVCSFEVFDIKLDLHFE